MIKISQGHEQKGRKHEVEQCLVSRTLGLQPAYVNSGTRVIGQAVDLVQVQDRMQSRNTGRKQ